MPFKAGNQLGKANKGRKREAPKTIWLLQSLAANGVNLEEMLAKALLKASKGDRQATDLAHLLAKMLPHVANAPKNDIGTMEIETLVINRFESIQPPAIQAIDTEVIPDESTRSGIKESTDIEGKSKAL
jgi:hypothetical protein